MPERSKGPGNLQGTFFLISAGFLMLASLLFRFVEAGIRIHFMKEHYGSYREALTSDIWFSEGWFAFIETPLGLTLSIRPAILLFVAIGCVWMALKTSR
jgi:hypothetical protein